VDTDPEYRTVRISALRQQLPPVSVITLTASRGLSACAGAAYSPALARRELEIIRTGLHANAVRICGRDPGRVLAAARDALKQGLEVWLSPESGTPPRRAPSST
jgi:hypothetical protein